MSTEWVNLQEMTVGHAALRIQQGGSEGVEKYFPAISLGHAGCCRKAAPFASFSRAGGTECATCLSCWRDEAPDGSFFLKIEYVLGLAGTPEIGPAHSERGVSRHSQKATRSDKKVRSTPQQPLFYFQKRANNDKYLQGVWRNILQSKDLSVWSAKKNY